MQHYLVTREQLDELKEKAVKLRVEPAPGLSELAGMSYEIEQLVADVETNPTDEVIDDDSQEMTDDDEDDDDATE